jgi:hypothetical protein
VENHGAAALGPWTDRITLTHDGVSVLVTERLHSGPLDAGASYLGSADLLIPIDFLGDYELIVVSDANAQLAERSRSNNRVAAPLQVHLAPYVDLVVGALTLDPEGALQPGETVTAHWLTSNAGNKAAAGPWSERLELRNAETLSLVATVDLASDGPLAAGASRSRSTQFTWPSGAAAAGRFLLRVIADAGGQLAEANPARNAETNNSAELLRVTGPDLLPGNLRVEPADVGGIEAGATLTLAWEIRNEGGSATDAVFNERIRVRNIDTDVVILDTHLAFDPLSMVDGQPAGPLQPGEPRQRHFNFTLPQGHQGSGRFAITLTTDQSQTGVGAVFEHNPQGDAEDNNRRRRHVLLGQQGLSRPARRSRQCAAGQRRRRTRRSQLERRQPRHGGRRRRLERPDHSQYGRAHRQWRRPGDRQYPTRGWPARRRELHAKCLGQGAAAQRRCLHPGHPYRQRQGSRARPGCGQLQQRPAFRADHADGRSDCRQRRHAEHGA